MFEEDYFNVEYFGWLAGNSSISVDNYLQIIHFHFRKKLSDELHQILKQAEESYFKEEKEEQETEEEEVSVEFTEADDMPSSFKHEKPLGEPDFDVEAYKRDKENNLITGLALKEHWSFDELYTIEFAKIKTLVLNNSGSLEDAKDVFQEAIIVLMEKLNTKGFVLINKVGTYLYSIAGKMWLNELRTRSLHSEKLQYIYQTCDVHVAEYNYQEGSEKSLLDKLSYLGKTCLKLLEYYYYKNWEWKDIAIELGYSTPASARNQKFKCLQKVIR